MRYPLEAVNPHKPHVSANVLFITAMYGWHAGCGMETVYLSSVREVTVRFFFYSNSVL